MAGNSMWTWLLPLHDDKGRATHMVIGHWRKQEMEQLYVRTAINNFRRTIPGGVLFAHSGAKEYPRRFPQANRLRNFRRELELRQTTTTGFLTMNDHRLLLTGIKPKELTLFHLIALVPDRPLREQLALMQKRLGLFVALCAAISLFLGVLLSQRFLAPIANLTSGVAAIEDRRFQHRVAVGEEDELGDLARTFNRVMEGLSDLEVGRIVQESLFPQLSVEAGEYRAFGRSSSASELGGDYFDLQVLSDGKVLMLVGDVSGHGVPAALVMAMAKALIERECETNPQPEKLLETVHRILFRTLKRKRMMTCFLLVLDPERGEITYANAGHNFPVLYRLGHPPRYLENKSLPLGSTKRNSFKADRLSMEPGDRVLLYTDGLVEAKTRAGQMIGYDRTVKTVAELADEDPIRSCDRIFAWHQNLTGGGLQDDDITVVLLTRKRAQPNGSLVPASDQPPA
jgi:HAMP domain-containing protein